MRKLIALFILISFSFIIFGCTMNNNNEKEEPVVYDDFFYNVIVADGVASQFEKVELALFEKELKIASSGNPYDYSYMKVMAEITSPSGKKTLVPAFWYQSSQINQTPTSARPGNINGVASDNPNEPQVLESVAPYGDPHYRVRFLPTESGKHNVIFHVYKNNVLVSTENQMSIDVEASNKEYKGFIQVDKSNNATFRFTDADESFIPVGQNTAWYTSSTRKSVDYEVWFQNMNENHMNQSRIWLAPWGFAVHGKSYNNFDDRFASLARLDKVVDLLEQYEIYTMLCLINHGQFSTSVNPTWNENPYNKENGGILDRPSEFFTKEEARVAYKNELMYLIARYSYSPYIMSWELFNEVDWCDGAAILSTWFKTWHSDMALFIKENDPYHHMVSTSYKGTDGNANSLDCLDFVSPHDYSYSNKNMITSIMADQKKLMDKYNKPVFYGEIGLTGENGYQNYQQDSQGIMLHQAAWAGMMSGAGGAMHWWWDSYVHPYNFYFQFKGAGIFKDQMNLIGSFSRLQDNASTSNSSIGIMGYNLNNKAYGYLFDKTWTFRNTSLLAKNNVQISLPLLNGDYKIELFDTVSGEIIQTLNASSNGMLYFTVPTITTDLAFIITSVGD